MMNDSDKILYLEDEIRILKTQLRYVDTGHIRTAINVLNERVSELKEKLNNEIK